MVTKMGLRKGRLLWSLDLVNILYVIPAHKTKTNNDWGENFEDDELRIAYLRIVF